MAGSDIVPEVTSEFQQVLIILICWRRLKIFKNPAFQVNASEPLHWVVSCAVAAHPAGRRYLEIGPACGAGADRDETCKVGIWNANRSRPWKVFGASVDLLRWLIDPYSLLIPLQIFAMLLGEHTMISKYLEIIPWTKHCRPQKWTFRWLCYGLPGVSCHDSSVKV